MAVEMTREASLVRSEGLLSFCNGCEGDSIRCNGRGKPAPLRKAKGIVRGEGWYYCHFAMVVRMERLVGVKQSLR